VVERVAELVSSWPAKWGSYRSEGSIGVLTPYADQVIDLDNTLEMYNASLTTRNF